MSGPDRVGGSHVVAFTDDIGRAPRSRASSSAQEQPSYVTKAQQQQRAAGSPTKVVMYADRVHQPQSSAHPIHKSTIVLGADKVPLTPTSRDLQPPPGFVPSSAPQQFFPDPAPMPSAPQQQEPRSQPGMGAQVAPNTYIPPAVTSAVDPRLTVPDRSHFVRMREEAKARMEREARTAFTGHHKRHIAGRASEDHIKDVEMRGVAVPDPAGTNLFIPGEDAHNARRQARRHQESDQVFAQGEADPSGTRLFIPSEEAASGGRHHSATGRRRQPPQHTMDHFDQVGMPSAEAAHEGEPHPRHRVDGAPAAEDHLHGGLGLYQMDLAPRKPDPFADRKVDNFDASSAQFAPPRPSQVDEAQAAAAGLPSHHHHEPRGLRNGPSSASASASSIRRESNASVASTSSSRGPLNTNPAEPGSPSPYSNHYARQKRVDMYKSQIGEPGTERHFQTTTRQAHTAPDLREAKPQPGMSHRRFYGSNVSISDTSDSSSHFAATSLARECFSPDKAHRSDTGMDVETRRNQEIDKATAINPRRHFDSTWTYKQDGPNGASVSRSVNQSTYQQVRGVAPPSREPRAAANQKLFHGSGFSLAHEAPSAGKNHFVTSNGVMGTAQKSHHLYD
eukprot:m.122245 g.122245  ORF g.122245 m.122245 type:complete len:619 (+) comp11102_c0_seq2:24-1880(+)